MGTEQGLRQHRTVGAQTIAPAELPLLLVDDGSMPLYLQLYYQLRHLIISHRIEDGAQLPAVRRMAEHLGINTGTVVQAYRELAAAGLTETSHGRGTHVRRLTQSTADGPLRSRLLDEAIQQLVLRARALGFDPATTRQQMDAQLLDSRTPVPVVFLGGTSAQAQRYAAELSTRLADRGVTFRPYAVGDLAAGNPGLRADLTTAYTVVAWVTRVPEVERELEALGVQAEILGVTAALSDKTLDQLRRMDPDTRYTLVTEQQNVTSILAQIKRESNVDHTAIQVVDCPDDAPSDDDRIAAAAATDNVLIFSFNVRNAVLAQRLADHRLLELTFELTASSLAQLDARWPART